MTKDEMVTLTVPKEIAEAIKAAPATIEEIKKDFDAMKKIVNKLQKDIKEITKEKDYRY